MRGDFERGVDDEASLLKGFGQRLLYESVEVALQCAYRRPLSAKNLGARGER